jgi:hypothetical protein
VLEPAILALLIPLAAIVGGVGIGLARMWMRHRERMAMIEMGMHPDSPEDPELLSSGERAELPARASRAETRGPR